MNDTNRIIRMRELELKMGLRRSTIYGLIASGDFPPAFKIVPGGRASGWLLGDIEDWLNVRASSQGGGEE
jgi:prophage regulatory protein